MLKKYPILKWTLLTLLGIIVLLVSFGFWFRSLLPPLNTKIETAVVEDLPYLTDSLPVQRGKILTVVTSTAIMGNSGKPTGYELTELARAYYVFTANGFEVDVASPLGGKPPVVIDDEDMGVYDFAFLNDPIAQQKANNSIPIEEVVSEDYDAVFFVGGKGAMFDFPENKTLQALIKDYYQSNKVIGAVCHGPAALVNVTLNNGSALLKNKRVSSFTNEEELLLIPDAATIFPFLLEDQLVARGASFKAGEMYLEKISHDANLITGQNPWSVWAVAEAMVHELGYTPKVRPITDEENAVKILNLYHDKGTQSAKELIKQMSENKKTPISRILIAKHSIIAAMQGEVGNFYNIIRLVAFAKKMETVQRE
ncbi:MAG: type 1 glutamine amidotransferase domain-containing protein [Flavobacteriaceae bacterium]